MARTKIRTRADADMVHMFTQWYITIGVPMICIPVNDVSSMRKLDLENSPGALIFLASKSQERLAEVAIKKELGLTPAQWKITLALSITDGLTQKGLADKIYIDSSTLVPIIDKMEENGLVERKSDSKDRRINRIFLTKKSESTVDSIIMIVLQLRKMIYHGISETQLAQVTSTLKTIIQNSETALSDIKSSPDKS